MAQNVSRARDPGAPFQQRRGDRMRPGDGRAQPAARSRGAQDPERRSDRIGIRGERRVIEPPTVRRQAFAPCPADGGDGATVADDETRPLPGATP